MSEDQIGRTAPRADGWEDEPAPPPEHEPFLRLLPQLFIVPLIIVVGCVVVFLLFGVIAYEGSDAPTLLEKVRTGGEHKRWQAAYELAAGLADGRFALDGDLADRAVAMFRDPSTDPKIRKFLVTSLGYVKHPGREDVETVLSGAVSEGDPEVRFNAVLALGALGDPRALAVIRPLLRDQDRGVRQVAVVAAAKIPGDEARQLVRSSLVDPSPDLRWNGALILAEQGDATGREVLLRMLNRATYVEVPGLADAQVVDAICQAARALARVGDAASREALEALAREDAAPRVRSAAADAARRLASR